MGGANMNVLSIGNSFSRDAHRYLNRIAFRDGVKLNTTNLYIGGCPLSLHYENLMAEKRAYLLDANGMESGFFVSIQEAVANRKWDGISFQQASLHSHDYASYQPYLDALVAYVRKHQPEAKIAIHQTWAYRKNSALLQEKMGGMTQEEMFFRIREAYDLAFRGVSADLMIPSGEVFSALDALAVGELYRDQKHASLGLGRYALSLTWYAALTGNGVKGNSFDDFDREITEEQKEQIQNTVNAVLERR
jgi:hypothetical protein